MFESALSPLSDVCARGESLPPSIQCAGGLMPDGRINIILGEGPTAQAGNDLDKWLAQKHARQA